MSVCEETIDAVVEPVAGEFFVEEGIVRGKRKAPDKKQTQSPTPQARQARHVCTRVAGASFRKRALGLGGGLCSQTFRAASASSNQWQPRPSSRGCTGIGAERPSEKTVVALLATKRSHEQHREKPRLEKSLPPRPMSSWTGTPSAANRH